MARRKSRPSPGLLDEPYTLDDLAQIRALADPLRLRILSTLGVERTTKQVAEILGEKPTKLYHHVAALERAGLVRLARKRQNRGTIEKYFVAVARAFKADARLFSPPGSRAAAPAAVSSVVSSALETTAREIERLVTVEADGSTLEEEGVLTFLEVRASAAEIRRLRGKIGRLIEGLGGEGGGRSSSAKPRRYRLTIAFFPLDVAERSGP
jgi:DNA-binding transcriptional ArsR family regulator